MLVRVETDAGLVGWGEAFALGAPAAVCTVVHEVLRPLLLGEPPTEIERLTDRLQRATLVFGRRGLAMFAISGVELALWDLAGQARGRPGLRAPGRPRPAPDSRLREPRALRSAGGRGPRGGGRRRPGVPGRQAPSDRRRVGGGRAGGAGPGVALMLDVNCPWTPDEAIRMGGRSPVRPRLARGARVAARGLSGPRPGGRGALDAGRRRRERVDGGGIPGDARAPRGRHPPAEPDEGRRPRGG